MKSHVPLTAVMLAMPDEWEIAHGLNPHDPSDAAADNDHDGYTNLEEYLNGTDPNQYVDYRDPKNNVNTLTRPNPQAGVASMAFRNNCTILSTVGRELARAVWRQQAGRLQEATPNH